MGPVGMYLSIRIKLLVALVSIIAAGYVAILFYLSKSETEVLKKRAIEHLKTQASYSVEHLELNLNTLLSEVQFLSRLEIMDDILANDIDKRVYKLLEKRYEDLQGNICLAAFDNSLNIVSSVGCGDMNLSVLGRGISERGAADIAISGRYMAISSPVYASFDENMRIGSLVFYKPLGSLTEDLYRGKGVFAWIVPPKKYADKLGDIFSLPKTERFERDFISVYMDIAPPLDGWKIGYAIEKKIAFKTIEEVQRVLLVAFVVLLILVVGLAVLVDRRIADPIRSLSNIASRIVVTGDYRLRSNIDTKDEIGDLGRNFNALMQRTMEAFNVIESQNRKHAQTLTELMRFFGRMIESETKEETIRRACLELKRLTSARRVYHTYDGIKPGGERVVLRCRLVREGERKEYGNIVIEGAKERVAMQKRFFEAAARMIALQIERIELLHTTTEALKSKTSFFSALSHELRTPLGSILSLTQYLITSDECSESAREALGKVENSAGHLLQIINDILLIAKAESGKLEPMFQRCNLVALIDESIQMVEPLADAKGIKLVCEFCSNRSSEFMTDPKLCRQVLINLLANAVKYTNEGEIRVELIDTDGSVKIVVKDSGIGIDPESLDRIFDEFYREHRDGHSEFGTGLGLALSKKIALALGGDIVIESKGVNMGTTATFILYE